MNSVSIHSGNQVRLGGKKSENRALELLKRTTSITFQIRLRRSGFKLVFGVVQDG